MRLSSLLLHPSAKHHHCGLLGLPIMFLTYTSCRLRSFIPCTMRRTLPRWRYMWAVDRQYRADFCAHRTVTVRAGAQPGKEVDRLQERSQADDMRQTQKSFGRGTDSRSAMGKGSSTTNHRYYAFPRQHGELIIQSEPESAYSRRGGIEGSSRRPAIVSHRIRSAYTTGPSPRTGF